ncbi:E3 ubiquitin-protein ligase Midline-1-like [Mytilus californianus]|uniref:E3 ubiquitin-protein ligase Midline-1-like n=1 Tax=Mytilus californianus TaxID=6549 RepID=UPI002247F7CC|nr:E3 ubiquitin-protein ligase Midline-1-like [Mytilus californianus]
MASLQDARGATVQKEFNDLLTCSICLETFRNPKYLPCLHTFCELCVNTYIISTVKEDKPDGFKCPLCRNLVPFDNSQAKPETWAAKLPGNYFIVSMIDRKAIQQSEKLCDTCEQKNVSQKAISFCTVCEETYCEPCETNHKLYKISRNHKTIPLQNIEEYTTSSKNFGFVNCEEHPDKNIEIFCNDHSKSCCTVCATVHHRKCEQVVTVDKVTSGIKQSTKARELMVKLKETSAELGNVILNHKDNMTTFEQDAEVVLTDIKSQKENIIKRLNELELQLQNETHATKKKVTLKMSDEAIVMSSLKSTVDNWKTIFEVCTHQSSDLQVLVKMEEISSRIPQMEKEIANVVYGVKDASISFEPEDINLNCLGSLTATERSVHTALGLKKVNFHSGRVNVLVTIDVDVKNVGERFLSGVFIDDFIILTDRVNYRILHSDQNGSRKEELKLASKPTDVVRMSDKKIAVASDSRQIHILNINPFIFIRTLRVKAPVWGLCYLEGEFITANSNTITWLNSETGVQIETYKTNIDTRFVTSYEKDEYIYMNGSNSVCFKSSKGRGFEYSNNKLSYAYSQDIDYDGNIYTTGYLTKNIHQLTSTGQLIRIIPTSQIDPTITDYPWVLRFQPNSNKFLLTFHYTGKVFICEIV